MGTIRHPNRPTGQDGLIAVDKVGNRVLFLDTADFETLAVLDGFRSRVHELAISPDHRLAYVPIYGDGRHGDNPNPGHLIAVIDLHERRHVGDIDVAPYLAPHCVRWGEAGLLYCTCEDSGVILELDAAAGVIRNAMEAGSTNTHRIDLSPDGTRLYAENEEDPFVGIFDLRKGRRVKDVPVRNGLAGLAVSPDGRTVVLVDAEVPDLLILDTATDTVERTIRLQGHRTAAQIARYSPDGRCLLVTSHDGNVGTILNRNLSEQRCIALGKGPMDMAFHPDGQTVLVGNQGDGTITVVDLVSAATRTIKAGIGVETLAFF